MKRLGHDAVSRCGSLSIRLTAAKISTRPIGLGDQGIDMLLFLNYHVNIAQSLIWDRQFGVSEIAHSPIKRPNDSLQNQQIGESTEHQVPRIY